MLLSKLTTLLDKSLAINQAKQIHAQILINGFSNLQPPLVGGILRSSTHYSQKTTRYVKSIIRHMQNQDIFSISCTIRFLSQHGQFHEAIAMYVELQNLGISPNTFALSSTLKACARVLSNVGVMIHCQVHKYGFSSIVYVQTALVDYYSKIGRMDIARKMFDEMRGKNIVSWNSILAGYVKSGDLAMAQSVFDEMPEKDVISWNSMVSGFAIAGNMDQAYTLFRQMPERNVASWNAMIGGHLDCGKVELARSFFDAMPVKNSVSYITMISGYSKHGCVEAAEEVFHQTGNKDLFLYNAMIACYAQNSRAKEALSLFNEMLSPDITIQPDKMTLASAISACSQLGDLKTGTSIESLMNELGIVMDDHLATSLIDLYVKRGSIEKACELFHGLKKKDLVAYTAMIAGCGINGRANDSIKLFEEMMDTDIAPNVVTFTGILTAYNHVGLVEEAYQCFRSMTKYGVVPSVDHYAIVVDILGRAGRVEEAYELIRSMPMKPHAGVWGALLLACSLHSNVELGEIAAKHCFELESENGGYRSLLANIYASAGKWDDANRLRGSIGEGGLVKLPGSSWMESTNT